MEMDPPSLINEEPYSNPNAAPYNLAEIWHFQMNGNGVISESELGERRAQFVPNLGQLGEASAVNHELSANALARKAQNDTMKRRTTEEDSPTGLPVSNGAAVNDNKKRHKTGASREMNSELKTGGELQNSQTPKQDYIHVRARRGQATDSHSLAERARREKISERMKILQDLVPGCNKVIGKALVLDEIINYIQSLQRQVEFLSMKIEAVDSRMSPGIEVFPPKDIHLAFQYGEQTFETNSVAFGSHATREFRLGSSPEWLHMQVGGAFERTT